MSVWPLRLLLAALLAFGSEVLLWTNPLARSPLDWPLLAVGYIAIAALLLDLITRFRVRDLFGALLLTGIYTAAAALALNPAAMLNDLPRTLFTRVMGAHALLALEMLGLFLALTNGGKTPRRLLLPLCGVVGAAWGIWARWWPPTDTPAFEAVPLPLLLLWGAGGLALIFGLLALAARRGAAGSDLALPTVPDASGLRLPPALLAAAVLLLLALAALRALQGALTLDGLFPCGLLLILCAAILWFRGRSSGRTLLDASLPPQPPPFATMVSGLALFFGVAVIAYNQPLIHLAGLNQLTFIGLGFTAYGLAWLPTVSLVLGVQAYLRQMQKNQWD